MLFHHSLKRAILAMKVSENATPSDDIRGGLFTQTKYLRLRKRYHWSGWPVYLIWTAWLGSITLWFLNLLYNNTVSHRAGF